MPRSGKWPVLNLLTGQKSGFSPSRGDLLHQFTSNLAGPTATWVCLAMQNFTSIATGIWECGPQNKKNQLFGKESPRRGDSFDRFRKNFQRFYTPNYHTLVFRIPCDSRLRLQSYSWETARRSIRPNFSVHPVPVGKTMRLIKNGWHLFWWARRALSPCKVWGRSHNARRL